MRAIKIMHKSIVLLYIIGKIRIICQNKELYLKYINMQILLLSNMFSIFILCNAILLNYHEKLLFIGLSFAIIFAIYFSKLFIKLYF